MAKKLKTIKLIKKEFKLLRGILITLYETKKVVITNKGQEALLPIVIKIIAEDSHG